MDLITLIVRASEPDSHDTVRITYGSYDIDSQLNPGAGPTKETRRYGPGDIDAGQSNSGPNPTNGTQKDIWI